MKQETRNDLLFDGRPADRKSLESDSAHPSNLFDVSNEASNKKQGKPNAINDFALWLFSFDM